MKVLLQSRTTIFSVPGGDTTQLIKTKEYLERLGVHVDISTELEPHLATYDIVHAFNLMRPQETYLHIRNARRQGRPTALSTIFGLYTECEKKAREGIFSIVSKIANIYQVEYLKIFARALLNLEYNKGVRTVLAHGYFPLLRKICSDVDVFLPNSEAEMIRVASAMGIGHYRHIVVPNAVDTSLFDPSAVTMNDTVKRYAGCVLCVASIAPRKNQLNLVRAMRGLPYRLVLIGSSTPNNRTYYDKVIREGGNRLTVLPHIEHSQLPSYYKAARVHVLASWMETPGLASLEAAAMGASIVVTEKGDTRDYFRDYAYYCEPDDVNSIRDAIRKAYDSPVRTDMREYIASTYTWDKAARKTLEGYNLILGGS